MNMNPCIVNTQFGLVEGFKDGSVYVWKGIPYASPPTGSLRFRAPSPPKPWKGVREAKDFGPAALQSESLSMKFLGDSPQRMSEDCLYLNIWSPAPDKKRRPVLVWIHGGSFNYGSGSSNLYEGKYMSSKGDVVIVTINYRLGVFGFLCLDDKLAVDYGISNNCGLLDQIAALTWIKSNIEEFGGDPNNITLIGESAGAVSVGCLLSMPIAKGLFQKAILQSGTARCHLTKQRAVKISEELLRELGVDGTNLRCLDSLPSEMILKKVATMFPPRTFGPVGDGKLLSESPEKSLRNGIAKDIPVLVGTNKDEARLFTHFDSAWHRVTNISMGQIFEHSFGDAWQHILTYIVQGRPLSRMLYEDIFTHVVFAYPAIKFAEDHAIQGGDVWVYRFDYGSPTLDGYKSAFHALEIPFVWGTILNKEMERITGASNDRFRVSEQMQRAWIAFAHTGDPNVPELPYWPRYNLQNRPVMLFDSESRLVNDPDKEKRLQWERVFVAMS
ncbi:MAG: carboxylesterase/lipase family protein [Alicyclobacillus sp.]|nr:carboxylesterase/lipase family protein [Alicyclobacillus sp.]